VTAPCSLQSKFVGTSSLRLKSTAFDTILEERWLGTLSPVYEARNSSLVKSEYGFRQRRL
jgi:hypothetical protein